MNVFADLLRIKRIENNKTILEVCGDTNLNVSDILASENKTAIISQETTNKLLNYYTPEVRCNQIF